MAQHQIGRQHDLFVILTIVTPGLVVDQKAADIANEFRGIGLDRIFPSPHDLVRFKPGLLALRVTAIEHQQFAFLEIVEQILFFGDDTGFVIFLQQRDCLLDRTIFNKLDGLFQFRVVLPHGITSASAENGRP